MSTITVQSEKIIARPIDIVRAQFFDMAHHEKTGVHAGLEVCDVQMRGETCQFTGRRKMLGLVQENRIEIGWQQDGSLRLRSIRGANEGLLITQAFEAIDPESTRVKAKVEMPAKGILKLLSPLVRMGLQRDLETALEEDRFDLEERGYPI